MKKIILFIILLSLIVLDTCKKEDNQPIIDSDFQEYFDRFLIEASARSIPLNISELKVSYSNNFVRGCGAGYCDSKQVYINSECWESMKDIHKEILMFHELGHALLCRIHDNSKLPNGDLKTLMDSTDLYSAYTEDTPEKREYYLNELFNPFITPPDWSAIKTNPTIIFKDTINASLNSWEYIKGPDNNYKGEFCSTEFLSPGTSLSITSYDLIGFSYWNYDFIPQGINQSDKLVLRAHVKLDAISKGGGVTVMFLGRGDNDEKLWSAYKTVTGTSDFIECNAELPYYVSSTKNIKIRLVLDQSTGKAYFDDITLIKYD